ncbi:MAG TPA: hypothetical protein VGL35_12245 [Rhizomicrobium sp.]|jgi:hypothetical protein
MNPGARIRVEESLRRIEQLVGALGTAQDGPARAAARELLEAVLDLHGIALAKIAAQLSASEEGRALYAAFADDEPIRAVLLLHGLHPDSPEERVRAAAAVLAREFGISLSLVSVRDGVARFRADPGAREWKSLCRAIGDRLIDVAPDLEDIAIERTPAREMLAAAAG